MAFHRCVSSWPLVHVNPSLKLSITPHQISTIIISNPRPLPLRLMLVHYENFTPEFVAILKFDTANQCHENKDVAAEDYYDERIQARLIHPFSPRDVLREQQHDAKGG